MAAQETLQRYLEEARRCEQVGRTPDRDRFLVLALDVAWQAGKVSEAERIWQRLRQVNPHHLVVGYSSLRQAMAEPVIQQYLLHIRSRAETQSDATISAAAGATSQDAQAETSGAVSVGELLLPLQTSLMRDSGSPATPASLAKPVTVARPSLQCMDTATDSSVNPPQRDTGRSFSLSNRQDDRVSPAAAKPRIEPPLSPAADSPPSNLPSSDLSTADRISPWIAGTLAVFVLAVGLVLLVYIVLTPFLLGDGSRL